MGLGIKGVNVKTEAFSVGFRASTNTPEFELTGEMAVGPFVVSPLTSGTRLGGGKMVAFGRDNEGKGNGGGSLPGRKPFGAVLPNSSCSSLMSIGSLELDFTSERYSRSSPERARE